MPTCNCDETKFFLTSGFTHTFPPAVLTGSDGPSHDLFSKTNQMTVWFFTDSTVYGRGFRANFTSGADLGIPGESKVRGQTYCLVDEDYLSLIMMTRMSASCAAGEFQCRTGGCIHGNSQCNAVVDCPDASDEADCGKSDHQ